MKTNITPLAQRILAANDQTPFYPAFSEGAPSGQIFAANDANLEASQPEQALTEYIVSYPDEEGLLAALEGIAPSVPCSRRFSYRKHDSREHFQLNLADEDIRQIGGEFAQVKLTGSEQTGKTKNKGLTMVIDVDEGGEDPAVQQRAVVNLRNRLLRTELYRAITTLDANDNNTATTWTSGTADPDGVVTTAVDRSGDKRGLDANLIVWGGSAWVKRKTQLRALNTPGGYAGLSLTPDEVAKMCGAQRGVVLPFRYQSAATESSKSKIAADVVFTYFAQPGAMASDPSNLKRFVTMTGGMFLVYVERRGMRVFVTVAHYSDIVATSDLGIEKLTVS